MKLYNQHVHSSYSVDGDGRIEKYYEMASKQNMPYFITTEHLDFDNIMKQDWIADYQKVDEKIKSLEKVYPNVKGLLGIEAGYRFDQYDKTLKVINNFDFDLVNLSIHDNGIYDYYIVDSFREVGIDKMLDIYFNNIILALNNTNNFEVLSHFDYGYKTAYKIDNTLKISKYEKYLKEIFSLLIKKDKALEINTKVQDFINSEEHLKYILTLYKSLGGKKLTLSSDCHHEKDFCLFEDISKKYIKVIKECGFDKLCYYIKRETFYLDI